jgi:hypothetical protein
MTSDEIVTAREAGNTLVVTKSFLSSSGCAYSVMIPEIFQKYRVFNEFA